MKVSVIIPAYNSEKTLRKAVESSVAAEAVAEVIIVDDGSFRPELIKIIIEDIRKKTSIPITLFCQENQGASAARNAGIKLAKEEWVCFLDSDDELLPSGVVVRFNHLLECNNQESIGVVYGSFRRSDTGKVQKFATTYDNVLCDGIGKKGGFPGGVAASVFRHSMFLDVGMLDHSLKAYEDFEFILRTHKFGWRVVGNSKPCFHRNYIAGSLTRSNRKFTIKQERAFLKKALKDGLLGRPEIARRYMKNFLKDLWYKVAS